MQRRIIPPSDSRPSLLRLHQPDGEAGEGGGVSLWKIGQWSAIVTVWTPEEWERLKDRPADVQRCSNGSYAVLRMA